MISVNEIWYVLNYVVRGILIRYAIYYNNRKILILPNHIHIYTNDSVAVLINRLFVQFRHITQYACCIRIITINYNIYDCILLWIVIVLLYELELDKCVIH